MITNVLLRIVYEVIARRIANGETFLEILKEYPKLTAKQSESIKQELEKA